MIWINLKIILGERMGKSIYYVIPVMTSWSSDKTAVTKSRSLFALGRCEEKDGLQWVMSSLLGEVELFCISFVVVFSQVYTSIKT